MPMCQHFIHGNCKFGSKCRFDHIDLKHLLRTEVEAVINGKQWLLSCLGMFKEGACMPNFINDQSFEEIRMGFLESTRNGTSQQFISSFIQEYNGAMNKLNELKMASADTIQALVTIYNSSNEQKSANQQSAVKPSTFGTSTATQNPFGGGIFGTSNNQPAMSTSSIFGASSSNANNPFQSGASSTSIFGASNEQKSSFSFAQPKASVFGNAPSAFGAQAQTPSIFGSQNQTTPTLGQAQTPSIFGSSAPQASIFGQSSFGQPAAATPSNIFGSSMQQAPQQTSSIFASQPVQQPQSVFGSFSAPQVPQQNVFGGASTNLFQQAQQATSPQQQQSSIFGQVQSPPTQQPQTNIFGGSMMQTQAPVQQPPTQNVFAIQQQPQAQPTGSIFSIQQPSNPSMTFGGNPFQSQAQVAQTIPESAYSKLEDLTAEEIEAFQAPTFSLGKIPLKPPPANLCL